jgi:ribosome-interacting GTPase 1
LLQGNRRYVKCLYVYNKIDVCSMEEVDAIARQPDSIPLSCTQRLNLDTLLGMLWDMMGLVCLYNTLNPVVPQHAGTPAACVY